MFHSWDFNRRPSSSLSPVASLFFDWSPLGREPVLIKQDEFLLAQISYAHLISIFPQTDGKTQV